MVGRLEDKKGNVIVIKISYARLHTHNKCVQKNVAQIVKDVVKSHLFCPIILYVPKSIGVRSSTD